MFSTFAWYQVGQATIDTTATDNKATIGGCLFRGFKGDLKKPSLRALVNMS